MNKNLTSLDPSEETNFVNKTETLEQRKRWYHRRYIFYSVRFFQNSRLWSFGVMSYVNKNIHMQHL